MSKELINETWAEADPVDLGPGVQAGYVNLRAATALVAMQTPQYGICAIFSGWIGIDDRPKMIRLPGWSGRTAAGDIEADLKTLVRRLHAPASDAEN